MNVPISILIYALRHKQVSKVRLFLYLKSICSGHFLLSEEMIDEVCLALKWKSVKTFKANLSWLVRHKWITVNSKLNAYRIVSYKQLGRMIKSKINTSALMFEDDFNCFRAFMYAAVITWSMKAKTRIDRKSGRKKGGPKKSFRYRDYFQLPVRYLAKILKVDLSSASRYKTQAKNAGFLDVKKQFENLFRTGKYLFTM